MLNCAVFLVEAGANARITDNDNYSAKDTAVNESQPEVAAYLRDVGQ